MRLIVIDTALGRCTAGVFDVDAGEPPRALAVESVEMERGHQERLGGLVRDAVAKAGGFGGVERVAVTVGPGSFTGLRVGLAFAQGLGAALDVPVAGVSTLDALALDAEEAAPGAARVAAVIDARRDQVYARLWRNGEACGPPQAMTVGDARAAVRDWGPDGVLIGSGAALLAEAAGEARILSRSGPTPQSLAVLGARAHPDAAPRPLYLRAPDATPPTRLPGQARSAPRPPTVA